VRRSAHLAAPAAGFAVVGLALLVFGGSREFQLVGGLTMSGSYALALQVVLALLLLGGIDDLRQPLIVGTSARNGRHRTPDTSRLLFDMRHALMRYYLSRPLPAFFLAFGLSVSLVTALIGLLDGTGHLMGPGSLGALRWSEVAAASILAVATLVQVRRPRPGFLGWCPGFAVGSALTHLVFDPQTDQTGLTWLGLARLLSVLWALALAAVALTRRRRGRGSRRAKGN
jgi:hypothetical protein